MRFSVDAMLVATWLGAAALGGSLTISAVGCKEKTDVQMYVDGFLPKNVRFEVEDQGPLAKEAVDAIARRPDVDGTLRLPDGACGGPCRVAIVSVFVHNLDADAVSQPPPVVRLKSPEGKPARQPIAFQGGEISKGRIGRIRWVVEMWPEEKSLTAILSSSVQLVETPASAKQPPVIPATLPIVPGPPPAPPAPTPR